MSQRLKILGVLLIAIAASAAAAEASMIAHWNFDEGNGATCADVSGNGYDGTLSDPATWGPGVAGSAVTFDGTEEAGKVTILDSQDDLSAGDLRSGGGWSFATWVKLDTRLTSQELLYCQTDAENYMFLRVMSSGRIRFHYEIGDVRLYSNYASSEPEFLVPTDEWTHVAVVLNADAAVGSQLKFYVNGVDATIGGAIDLASTSLALPGSVKTLGYSPSYHKFDGSLDDARLYDHALSSAEIQTLVSIPEPGMLVLLALGAATLLLRRPGE